MRYERRHKEPQEIEAIAFTGDNFAEVDEFTGGRLDKVGTKPVRCSNTYYLLAHARIPFMAGDYIVKWREGDYNTFSPARFHEIYKAKE